MNKTDFESPVSSSEAQETADASSTYAVATINCQATTGPISSVSNNENDSPTYTQASGSSNGSGTLKVFAPVITHDVTLPNTAKKVPMVMVPVPDSKTLMAIPMSTLSQLKDSNTLPMDVSCDEQQARDLLVWNEGIGTLDGCDLRFKLNQLGCLELLDSDDESENQNLPKHHAISNKTYHSICNDTTIKNKTTNGINSEHISTNTSSTASNNINVNNLVNSSANFRLQKRAKLDVEPTPVKQISPGSSLLRDGPNTRRHKTSSGSSFGSIGRTQINSSLLKKLENNQNSILLDKLVPKQKLDEIRTNIEKWTVEDVKKFVDSIPGCSGYGESFELQQICGKSLMYLDQRDLLDVINVKLGPAVKIYHAISLLK